MSINYNLSREVEERYNFLSKILIDYCIASSRSNIHDSLIRLISQARCTLITNYMCKYVKMKTEEYYEEKLQLMIGYAHQKTVETYNLDIRSSW